MSDGDGESHTLLEVSLVEKERRWKRTLMTKERCREKKTRKKGRGTGRWRWRGCENGSVSGNVSWTGRAAQLHRV
jgi:hypothetical protein